MTRTQFVDNTVIEEEILMAERNATLRAAFAELPPRCQQLLAMLFADPPHSYAEISATLGHPGRKHRPAAGPLPGTAAPVRGSHQLRWGRVHRSAVREAGKVLESWDDEQLLAALREAMRARQAVPDEFVETGKSAYAWHNIDAELAQLTYDSGREQDRDVAASVRSETASIRALTFTSAHVSLELEVTDEFAARSDHPAAGRDDRDADQGGRDHDRPRSTRSAVSRSTPSRPARSGCAAASRTAPTC